MKLTVENVSKVIHKNAVLQNVSLECQSGQITGLKGVNGSGKTMIMRIICGLIHPTEGRVMLDDLELKKDIDFPESIGIIIDSPAFLPEYSALDNLKFLFSYNKNIKLVQLMHQLEEVSLGDVGKKKYKHFSLGMKQRLGIAAAVIEQPEILLIDEPTNALDDKGIKMIKDILLREKERGALIVLSCHDTEFLKSLSDQIYFVEEGRITNHVRL